MQQLQQGDKAPDFTMRDLNGVDFSLSEYRGKKVLLTFFRFATCPFCTVRFARLAQEVGQHRLAGVEVIGVFESSADYILQYLGNRGLPFRIVADPNSLLYARFGLEKSMLGLLLGMFRLPTLMRAMFDKKYRMAKPDASLSRIPADFLIGADQVIECAYYGRDIGDHLPFHLIEKFANQLSHAADLVQPQSR